MMPCPCIPYFSFCGQPQFSILQVFSKRSMISSRYAVLYMNLGPYHMARLRALAEVLPATHAIEVAGRQKLYPWRPSGQRLGFDATTLFPGRVCESVSPREQRGAVEATLSQIDPRIILVAGYREPVMRAAVAWARDHHVPAILHFVSTYADAPRCWWKEFAKRRHGAWAQNPSVSIEWAMS